MTIRRNAVLTALTSAGAVFIGLIIAARMSALVALLIALVVAGLVIAFVNHPQSVPSTAPPDDATPEPPPPQYQARPIAGIPLPSAHEDYRFAFSATVYWLPMADGVAEPGAIAVSEIVRRAREIAERRDPAQAALVMHELAVLLADAKPDRAGRVHARAESIQLQLSADDQRRLEELASLRKQEQLWDYQRRQEQSKRRYLSEDVLKDAGSAVVWWLARNDDQPVKVAENIEMLTKLAHAASNANGDRPGEAADAGHSAPTAGPCSPQDTAEQFGAFVDSLGLLDDDARLTLTKQVARLMERHGHPDVATEMNRQYGDWPDSPVPGL